MAFVNIDHSRLLPGVSPVPIHYREAGAGTVPLVFLHGGWGYEIYPFDAQIAEFRNDLKIIAPDRSGYGRSPRITGLPSDFHQRAAGETLRLLDALEIERAILWGHSDGAVIGAIVGLSAPERVVGLVLEAFHYDRAKPGSRQFFETMASDPEQLGERVGDVLERDHGTDYWRELIRLNGRAWLTIARESDQPAKDLFGGRLSELTVPALFLHGRNDPRTEPGEMETVRSQLPDATLHYIEGAGHSPHSERDHAAECNRVAREFFQRSGQLGAGGTA